MSVTNLGKGFYYDFGTEEHAGTGGFNLVELAIVMIIIGLLIAGVLKGQALIQNAQVTSTVAQLKATEAAISTFHDTYASIPGDLLNAATRLPSCGGACVVGASAANNGNGRLENLPVATPIGAENEAFFPQLAAAGLVTGLSGAAAASTTVGGNFPATKIANNVLMASSARNNLVSDFGALIGAAVPDQGLYMTINNSIAAPVAGTTGLKPDQAFRIDTKMDDGVTDTGLVRAFGTAGNTANAINCGLATAGGVPSGMWLELKVA